MRNMFPNLYQHHLKGFNHKDNVTVYTGHRERSHNKNNWVSLNKQGTGMKTIDNTPGLDLHNIGVTMGTRQFSCARHCNVQDAKQLNAINSNQFNRKEINVTEK